MEIVFRGGIFNFRVAQEGKHAELVDFTDVDGIETEASIEGFRCSRGDIEPGGAGKFPVTFLFLNAQVGRTGIVFSPEPGDFRCPRRRNTVMRGTDGDRVSEAGQDGAVECRVRVHHEKHGIVRCEIFDFSHFNCDRLFGERRLDRHDAVANVDNASANQ